MLTSENASIIPNNDSLMVSGVINFATAASLLKASLPLLAQCKQLSFNFSQVTHSNSAALALLLEWMRYAKKANKAISFHQLPEQLKSVARAAGLQGAFSF